MFFKVFQNYLVDHWPLWNPWQFWSTAFVFPPDQGKCRWVDLGASFPLVSFSPPVKVIKKEEKTYDWYLLWDLSFNIHRWDIIKIAFTYLIQVEAKASGQLIVAQAIAWSGTR